MSSYLSNRFEIEVGSITKGLLSLVLVLVIALTAVAYTFGYVIPPGTMGVRQITFGPSQGFAEDALGSGYHWSIPFYSTIHFIPETVQALHFNRTDEGKSISGPLELQTADRATVDVDLSLLTRFYRGPGKDGELVHGGPSDLLRKVGTTQDAWVNHVRRVVDDQLKRTLGTLSTGEFYDPFKREAQIKLAHASINEALANYGIKMEAVLLRRYTYRAERIDNAIFQKNLQDQEERLNVTASKFAEAHAQLEQVAAEWDAKIKTLEVEGDNKARVIRSEGDLFETTKRAEGDLLVAQARAEVDRLRAGALAQSTGADIFVAREMAPLLGSLKGGVVSDLDPYDLDTWMKRLGVPR